MTSIMAMEEEANTEVTQDQPEQQQDGEGRCGLSEYHCYHCLLHVLFRTHHSRSNLPFSYPYCLVGVFSHFPMYKTKGIL